MEHHQVSAAWIVIEGMLDEIQAQLDCQGNSGVITVCDEAGRIHISGTIDLPALAVATELALIEFNKVEKPK